MSHLCVREPEQGRGNLVGAGEENRCGRPPLALGDHRVAAISSEQGERTVVVALPFALRDHRVAA
ncbi:hypothetical protein, partial [Aeromonas caviae]|uniref:hypothetical protein n=1 Tax=Aeromonas caviae TaxID=648 RepID=UPI002B47DF36